MITKQLIYPEGRRRLPKSFSWLDHRLARSGHLPKCSSDALALYLFLVIVGDSDGLSYYSDKALCSRLALSREKLPIARKNLLSVGLIAYKAPLYQVLDLDCSNSTIHITPGNGQSALPTNFRRSRSARPQCVGDILKNLSNGERS